MTSKRGTRRIISTSLAAGLALLLMPALAGASTYFNPTAVSVPVFGAADPYPSTISVQGLPGKVSNVKVGINGLEHPDVEDLDMVVVSPSGQVARIFSDVCATASFANASFVFDDDAPAELGAAACDVETGTFRPSDPFETNDNFQAPGPGLGIFPKQLAVFNGIDPNGNWNLFVTDDDNGGGVAHSLSGGWSLELDLNARCAGQQITDAGTAGPDQITGTAGIDVITALGGNDKVSGLGGEDVVCGGPGNDRLLGGGGKDRLLGEAGKDQLIGGGGPDICIGGAKKDKAKSCSKVKSL